MRYKKIEFFTDYVVIQTYFPWIIWIQKQQQFKSSISIQSLISNYSLYFSQQRTIWSKYLKNNLKKWMDRFFGTDT